MKFCPKCNTQYEAEMSFCLQDGTPLIFLNAVSEVTQIIDDKQFDQTLRLDEKTLVLPDFASEPTEHLKFAQTEETVIKTESVKPKPPIVEPKFETFENPPKSRTGLLIGAILGVLALFGIGIGSFAYLQLRKSDEVAIANSNNSTNNQSTTNTTNSNSNSNVANLFGSSNSTPSTLANSNTKPSPATSPTLSNSNKETPKPTIEKEETPTPKPTATATPIQSTPTATPISRPTRPPQIVSGGVMNGKAVNLVRPPYPPAAKAVRASGAVTVQVTIDENGNVISASAISGHALLKSAAESAARASKFSPTILGGQAVKVTGVIVYNFTAQ